MAVIVARPPRYAVAHRSVCPLSHLSADLRFGALPCPPTNTVAERQQVRPSPSLSWPFVPPTPLSPPPPLPLLAKPSRERLAHSRITRRSDDTRNFTQRRLGKGECEPLLLLFFLRVCLFRIKRLRAPRPLPERARGRHTDTAGEKSTHGSTATLSVATEPPEARARTCIVTREHQHRGVFDQAGPAHALTCSAATGEHMATVAHVRALQPVQARQRRPARPRGFRLQVSVLDTSQGSSGGGEGVSSFPLARTTFGAQSPGSCYGKGPSASEN